MKKENNIILTENEVTATRILLKVFEEQKTNKRVTISYGELTARLQKEVHKTIIGEDLGSILFNIDVVCQKLNIPFISSIVVLDKKRIPSYGYRKMLKELSVIKLGCTKEEEREIEKNEIVKGQSCKDWSKLKKYIEDRIW